MLIYIYVYNCTSNSAAALILSWPSSKEDQIQKGPFVTSSSKEEVLLVLVCHCVSGKVISGRHNTKAKAVNDACLLYGCLPVFSFLLSSFRPHSGSN